MKLLTSILCFALILSPLPIAAQGAVDPDAKEMADYRLTMTGLQQFAQVMKALAVSLPKNPTFQKIEKLKAEQKAIENKEEPSDAEIERAEKLEEEIDALEDAMDFNISDAKTLAEMEARLKKSPELTSALRSAGLSARDYAKMTFALIGAAFAHGMLKSGTIKELPKEVNAANVKFVADNEQAIAELMKSFDPKKQ